MIAVIKGGLKALGSVARLSPALLWQRRRAIAKFRRQLHSRGMDKETVERLSAVYKEMGNVQRWMSGIRKK